MSLKYPFIIFDLDGTLTDSGAGIIHSVQKTLNQMDWQVPGTEILRRFIGPPLWTSFTHFCAMEPKQANQAVEYFHEIYNSTGIFENKVYEGIPQLLTELQKSGACLAVATSKPRTASDVVLEHFHLKPFFKYISAEDDSERGGGKEARISQVLEESGFPADRAVMIGDTKFDAAGACKSGTNFIGVLYGFGTKEEMQNESGTQFAENPAQLAKMLIDKE